MIRLKQYVPLQEKKKFRLTRENIFLRDKNQCQYCETHFPSHQLTLDHVIPLSKGGGHSWENITTACHSCNNKKGNKTLKEYGHQPLNKPSEPKWLPQKQIHKAEKHLPTSWLPYLRTS